MRSAHSITIQTSSMTSTNALSRTLKRSSFDSFISAMAGWRGCDTSSMGSTTSTEGRVRTSAETFQRIEKPWEEGENEARGNEVRWKEAFVGMIQGWWLRAHRHSVGAWLGAARMRNSTEECVKMRNSTEECVNLRCWQQGSVKVRGGGGPYIHHEGVYEHWGKPYILQEEIPRQRSGIK